MKNESLLEKTIIERLKTIDGFSDLNLDDIAINKICKSFINGFVEDEVGRITYIVAKNKILNFEKLSDSDISFWVLRILERPLMTINVKKRT